MSIIAELPSQTGKRTQDGNSKAAEKCLTDPRLLSEIVQALGGKDARLAGDCAEVLTKVGEKEPALVAPHAPLLLSLLGHKNGRVRWESAHALALASSLVPALIGKELERLTEIIREDESVIVRDYVIDAVAGYGATSAKSAALAFPVLREAAPSYEGKHAARILLALPGLLKCEPKLVPAARKLAAQFLEHARSGVRKAATKLQRTVAKS